MFTTKRTCTISCETNAILILGGKTLYCPPIVNSPNGNPHIISIDMIITIEKTPAPIKDIIILPPENPNHIRHPALTFHQTQRLSLPKFYDEMFSILLLAI